MENVMEKVQALLEEGKEIEAHATQIYIDISIKEQFNDIMDEYKKDNNYPISSKILEIILSSGEELVNLYNESLERKDISVKDVVGDVGIMSTAIDQLYKVMDVVAGTDYEPLTVLIFKPAMDGYFQVIKMVQNKVINKQLQQE